MHQKVRQFGPVVVTLALLAYLAGVARLEVAMVGVEDYMARSHRAIEALPMKVGTWEATRQPLDAEARDMLKPNAEITLRYSRVQNYIQYQADYSVIQAADSRFMTGHAPVNCYKNNGYDIVKQLDRVWRVGEIDVKGIEYEVHRRLPDGRIDMRNVRNFFIFPDGHFGATLAELDQAASDYRKLKYGVTQVQLVTAAGLTDKQRDQAFSQLVGSERSLEMIRILRTGIPK